MFSATFRFIASHPLAALVCFALFTNVAHGQSSSAVDKTFAQTLSAAELKHVYLACDLASSKMRLALHEAMQCSIVQEELKHRVFGGNFEHMLVWWREQRGIAKGNTPNNTRPLDGQEGDR